MGLFDKSGSIQVSPTDKHKSEIELYLQDGEVIENIFPLIVSYFCITNKRFIFVENDFNFKEPRKLVYTIPFSKVSDVGLIYNESIKMVQKNEIQIVTKGVVHNLEFLKAIDIVTIYNEITKKII